MGASKTAGGDGVRGDVAEVPGGALQGLVSILEIGELDEALALGHNEKLGLETTENRIDIGVDI